MRTPNREPQEYSRSILGIYLPGSYILLNSYYILGVPCLGFPLESLYIRGLGFRNAIDFQGARIFRMRF